MRNWSVVKWNDSSVIDCVLLPYKHISPSILQHDQWKRLKVYSTIEITIKTDLETNSSRQVNTLVNKFEQYNAF